MVQKKGVPGALWTFRSGGVSNNTLEVAVDIPLVSEQFLEPWQLRRIPSTTDGFDKENAGIHTSPLNIDIIALIC